MDKVLTFRVEIEGLENKIWRKIEITDRRTVADLAYTILASFNSLAYHLYDIVYKNNRYDCWVCTENYFGDEKLVDATIAKLKSLKLKKNDKMVMEYDFGSTTTFIITYLEEREFKTSEYGYYPYITEGSGAGMLDDISSYELKRIVDDIDEKGYSEYHYTPGYETRKKYDYRKYDIKKDNKSLKGMILEIKNGYEVSDE